MKETCHYHDFERYGANPNFCMACGKRWTRKDRAPQLTKREKETAEAINNTMKRIRARSAAFIASTPRMGPSSKPVNQYRQSIFVI